jgi:hypothetical protein
MADSTYVIWDGRDAVKIGKEKNGYPDFPSRLKGNQTGNASELRLVARHRDDHEMTLHRAMRPWRIRSGAGREWFTLEKKEGAQALQALLAQHGFELCGDWYHFVVYHGIVINRAARRALRTDFRHEQAVHAIEQSIEERKKHIEGYINVLACMDTLPRRKKIAWWLCAKVGITHPTSRMLQEEMKLIERQTDSLLSSEEALLTVLDECDLSVLAEGEER